jgi:hypothetical protein
MVFMHVIQLIRFTCMLNTNCCMCYGMYCDMVCTPNTNCCMLQSFSRYTMLSCVFFLWNGVDWQKGSFGGPHGKEGWGRTRIADWKSVLPSFWQALWDSWREQQLLSSDSKSVWSPSHPHEVCMSVRLEFDLEFLVFVSSLDHDIYVVSQRSCHIIKRDLISS